MSSKTCVFLLALLFMLTTFLLPQTQQKKTITIGMVLDGSWKDNESVLDTFKKEIRDLMEGEYTVRFPSDKILVGNWTPPPVRTSLKQLLDDPQVDLVLALGLMASHEACLWKDLPKPVIAPFILDPELQGLPRKGAGSGKKNLNYIVALHTIGSNIKVFRRIVPFNRIIFLTAEYVKDYFLQVADHMTKELTALGLTFDTIWVGHDVEQVISRLTPDIPALYITPAMHLPEEDFLKIVETANRLKIPTFSHLGKEDVRRGVLASVCRDSDFVRLSRRVALNIQRIFMGEDAGSLPVDFDIARELSINMKTARQIGVYPTWDIMTEAELMHEEEIDQRSPLTLMEAVNQGLKANLQLLSKQQELLAGRQDIRAAAAKLMPHIEVSGLGVKIDEDRALSSMGMSAENTISGSASLTQVIFSEAALANLAIQKKLHLSREAQLDQVTLDIALSASVSYMNVLRAQALERVQKQNLKKTRSNLELAKVRKSLGASGPADVYRWEALYATARKDVMDAGNMRELAEINLNRVLHLPQGKRFKIAEAGLDEPFLTTSDKRFFTFIDNPWIFKHFLDFIVEDGLARSPELAQLDAAIAAKDRYARSAGRKSFLPTVALSASITNYFSKTGAGTGERDMSHMIPAFSPAQLGALGSLFPATPNDLDWSVALKLSIPVFSGGENMVESKKARLELKQMRTQRKMLAEQLEQRIRGEVRQTGTRNAQIDLSREASEAAGKTLELVTDAYSRGALSILDLIDAQNAALAADRAAANAIYDFMVELFTAQRATNRLDFLISPDSQQKVLDQFEKYLKQKGIHYRKKS